MFLVYIYKYELKAFLFYEIEKKVLAVLVFISRL